MQNEKPIQRIGWSMSDWTDQVGLCKATGYALLRQGRIKAKKVGAATRIITPPEEFLAEQEDYKPGSRQSPNPAGNNGRRARRDRPSTAA